MNLNRILQGVNQWLLQTPERSLDEAYHAALKIKEIEDKHVRNVMLMLKDLGHRDTIDWYIAERLCSTLNSCETLGYFKKAVI